MEWIYGFLCGLVVGAFCAVTVIIHATNKLLAAEEKPVAVDP